MRAFVSINLQCTEKIGCCLDHLNKAGIKTGDRSQFHVTLKFLGDVSDEKIQQIIQTLEKEVSSIPCFTLKLDRLGTFPRGESGIVWIGSESKEAAELANRVDDALSRLKFPKEDRAFKCHVTVARVKRGIGEAKKFQGVYDFESFEVKSICLMRSTLTPEGPIYKTVAEFPLKVQC